MGSIINNHNKKILNNNNNNNNTKTQNGCNCRKRDQFPLDNNCLIISVIYKTKVTTDKDNTGKNYIGLKEGTFKQRYTQHKLSFRNRKYAYRTELAKHIWKLKDNKGNYKISWSISSSASAYNFCLSEKLHIIKAGKESNRSKRTELVSKCHHENKYLLMNTDRRSQFLAVAYISLGDTKMSQRSYCCQVIRQCFRYVSLESPEVRIHSHKK